MGGELAELAEEIHDPTSELVEDEIDSVVPDTEQPPVDPIADFLEKHGSSLIKNHEGQFVTVAEAYYNCEPFQRLVNALGEKALSFMATVRVEKIEKSDKSQIEEENRATDIHIEEPNRSKDKPKPPDQALGSWREKPAGQPAVEQPIQEGVINQTPHLQSSVDLLSKHVEPHKVEPKVRAPHFENLGIQQEQELIHIDSATVPETERDNNIPVHAEVKPQTILHTTREVPANIKTEPSVLDPLSVVPLINAETLLPKVEVADRPITVNVETVPIPELVTVPILPTAKSGQSMASNINELVESMLEPIREITTYVAEAESEQPLADLDQDTEPEVSVPIKIADKEWTAISPEIVNVEAQEVNAEEIAELSIRKYPAPIIVSFETAHEAIDTTAKFYANQGIDTVAERPAEDFDLEPDDKATHEHPSCAVNQITDALKPRTVVSYEYIIENESEGSQDVSLQDIGTRELTTKSLKSVAGIKKTLTHSYAIGKSAMQLYSSGLKAA